MFLSLTGKYVLKRMLSHEDNNQEADQSAQSHHEGRILVINCDDCCYQFLLCSS